MSSVTESTPTVPSLDPGLRINLSIMMFLQFAIWGAWYTVIGNYLDHLGFDASIIGWVYSLMPLGAIVSPMIISALADRYVASERLMAVLHLLGAVAMYYVAQIKGKEQVTELLTLLTAYSLLYNPTLALSNSIVFSHVPDGQRDFPGIRVLGTLGWIAAGLVLDFVLGTEKPAFESNQFLLLTAGLSAVLGVYSFFLPHTPPSGKPGDALPFVKALGLFRDSSFAVFFGVSFVITIVLAFYYGFTGIYLEKAAGVKNVASTMIWGQVAETILLPMLPLFLWYMGMKWVLALGMFCWGLRYAFFALGQPYALVFLGILLHGACFDFFFAAGFIHVDNEAPKDIRASGQALFGFLTYGLGMFRGSIFGGYLAKALTTGTPPNEVIDWQTFWLVPSIGVLASLAVFVIFFRMRPKKAEATASA
jgi:nucleoside transporter